METLSIKPTIKTPLVTFDARVGELRLEGKSIPENSMELYRPLIAWVAKYVESPAIQTTFIFKLSYFNSSSTEYILDILKRLDKMKQEGQEVTIKWYYSEEDEDMEYVGEDFKMMLNMPIEMIAVSEEEMEAAGQA